MVIRHQDGDGYRYRVLVWNLDDVTLARLAGRDVPHDDDSLTRLCLAAYAYDNRGGGIETSNKNSKYGLGLMQRNKRSAATQGMVSFMDGQMAQPMAA